MTMILKIISLYETEMKNSILSEYPSNNPLKPLNHGTIEEKQILKDYIEP